MPSWNDLKNQFDAQPNDQAKFHWIEANLVASLQSVSNLREGRNVILYASSFLQKPQVQGPLNAVNMEDINGLMSVMQGMDCSRNLTLILHTPGGDPAAANALVAYLHSKFSFIEAIIPAYAMSAGTMISLGTNRLIMGRQSQVGPIDAQMLAGNGYRSAGAIIDAFERAKADITANPVMAHLWHPILQGMGPSLLVEAQNNLDYGEHMVKGWLEKRMFAGNPNAAAMAAATAKHFNAVQIHKYHSRRIDRDEARAVNVAVEDLETNQLFQDAVLTNYHVFSLNFLATKAAKVVASSNGVVWQRNI
jgi:hypothetical protein